MLKNILAYAFITASSIINTTYNTPSTTTIQTIVQKAATQYGVDASQMYQTMQCEDRTLDPLVQSSVPDRHGPNGRENSWGITQIDLDYNPDITKEQAQDPVFSADLMAKNFSKGKQYLYHCYTKLFGNPRNQ